MKNCQNCTCTGGRFLCSGDPCNLEPPCKPNEFMCNNGQCIPSHWKCDGHNDCIDYSDEDNCIQICNEQGLVLKFSPKKYFSKKFWQKNINSVKNNFPKKLLSTKNISWGKKFKTNYQEFQCPDGICIPKSFLCDGQHDCFGGIDELNCTGSLKIFQIFVVIYILCKMASHHIRL